MGFSKLGIPHGFIKLPCRSHIIMSVVIQKWQFCMGNAVHPVSGYATRVFTCLHVRIVRRSGTEPVAHFVWRNGPPADNRI